MAVAYEQETPFQVPPEAMSKSDLIKLVKTQQKAFAEVRQRTDVNALENEVRWLNDVIFNPSFNETDIRLLVSHTPREMRMGLTNEVPEEIIWLPKAAEQAHTSPKTASARLRILAKATGAFSYRSIPDEETGQPRVHLKALPPAETPAQLERERAKRGGSTWKDGKRVKRCPECDSPLIQKRTQYQCMNPACLHPWEGKWQSVNNTDDMDDEEPNCQDDSEGEDAEEQEEEATDPHCHLDTEVLADEISNLPSSTCTQRGDDDTTDDPHSQYDSESPESENFQNPEQDTPDSHIDSEPQPASAAEELQSLKQWIPWRYGPCRPSGKRDKLPFSALSASPMKYSIDVTDPAFWSTYAQAQAIYEQSQSWKLPYDGVGFCFKKDGGIVGIDQDGLLDPIINSYSERSVSGDGLHTFVHGSIPRNIKRDDLGIEMYDHDRYFTWTGDHLPETPIFIADLQGELDTLFADIAPPVCAQPPPLPIEQDTGAAPTDSDDAIIEKAMHARNGEKFTKLWNGDYSDYRKRDGSPDHSQGDLSLCRMLAFWTDKHIPTMDRLFRQSGLMRPKWDHNARSGETYGQGTLRRALSVLEVPS